MVADSLASNLAVLITLIGVLSGIIAAIVVLARVKGTKDSVNILATANEALRDTNADLQTQILDQHREFDLKLVEQDRECQRQLAEVKGQLAVLTSNLGKDIGAAVVAALKEA